jgi:hypothetical protein
MLAHTAEDVTEALDDGADLLAEPMSDEFTISETGGVRIVEGPPDRPVMRTVDDAALVVETCFSNRALSALLYAENLTEHFFDLSSGEAGAVLQKLRNYRIRVLRFDPPIEMTGNVQDDTQRIHAHLENLILQHADQYLWVHRRWKTRPAGEPSIY